MIILVTVGSTRFDMLVQAVDRQSGEMKEDGHELVFQIGHGRYLPSGGRFFRFRDDMGPLYQKADVAITHGGVGTIFEALEAGCAVVGVDNPDLQEGHQAELLEALDDEGVIVWCHDLGRIPELVKTALDLPSYSPPKSNLALEIVKVLEGKGGGGN